MSMCNNTFRCSCTLAAVIASLIVGIIGAFLQITAVFTVSPVFLWVAFGIAVVFLGLLILVSGRQERSCCQCSILSALLAGILGTVLFSILLLAIGIVATCVLTAVLTGLVLFFLSLLLTSAACYVLCIADCMR
nr:hypothetical protein [Oscillospiraceae bacterium]